MSWTPANDDGMLHSRSALRCSSIDQPRASLLLLVNLEPDHLPETLYICQAATAIVTAQKHERYIEQHSLDLCQNSLNPSASQILSTETGCGLV